MATQADDGVVKCASVYYGRRQHLIEGSAMTDIPRHLVEAFSNRTLSRRDIGERLDRYVGFGDLLAALHEQGLPLPRYPSDPNSEGARLVEKLALRAGRA